MSNIRPTQKQWNDFVEKFVSTDGVTNIKGEFSQITKGSGVPYFEFLRASWVCIKDYMTVEEFCKVNGNVPIKFFEKNIRDHEVTKLLEEDTKITSYE